jgi:hypothetical protein
MNLIFSEPTLIGMDISRRSHRVGGGTKTTRKAPRAHASETELGRVMYVKENGKNMPWIVEEAGKSKRWNKATGYFTHDNGGRPFYVKIQDGKIIVTRGRCDDACATMKDVGRIYDKHVLSIPSYKKVWIGENSGKYANKREVKATGNSILVHVAANKYVYIGDHLFEFTASDNIKEFHGIIGNSDVVYAFGVGDTNTYFFIEDKFLPNTEMKKDEDPYKTYFEHLDSAKKISGKIIAKRVEN